MSAPRRPAADHDGHVAHQGKVLARALVELDAGDVEEQSGWRGALQRAADLSHQDPAGS